MKTLTKNEKRCGAMIILILLQGSNPATPAIGETVGICRRSFAMPVFMWVCYSESLESPIITLESKIE